MGGLDGSARGQAGAARAQRSRQRSQQGPESEKHRARREKSERAAQLRQLTAVSVRGMMEKVRGNSAADENVVSRAVETTNPYRLEQLTPTPKISSDSDWSGHKSDTSTAPRTFIRSIF